MKKIFAFSAAIVMAPLSLAAQENAALPQAVRPFIDAVIASHPSTAATMAGISQARAKAKAAGLALYNPELSLDASPVVASPPDSELYTNYSASISLAVEMGGKGDLRQGIGQRQADAAVSQAQGTQLALAADLLSALADLQATRKNLEIAGQQADLAGRFLDLSERRNKAGELPAMELGAARLAMAEASRGRQDAELAMVSAEESLRAACLCDIGTAPVLPDVLPTPPRFSEDRIEELAYARPEVQAARNQSAAARHELELAQAQRMPDPSFRLGGSKEGQEKRVLVGVSIPIPVLNNGSATVTAAGRALAQAEAAERQAVLTAAAAIRSSMRTYARTVQGVESWRTLGIPSLERQADTLTRLWRGGDMTATDFLVQMRETGQANATEATLRNAAWSAFADLMKAAGIPPSLKEPEND